MKRVLLAGLLVAATLACVRPAAAADSPVWQVNGTKAHYDAFEMSADGCRYRRLALEVVENAHRDGATTGSQTLVSGLLASFDFCNPDAKVGTLLAAYAQPVPAGALTFDRDLSTVHLSATVTFGDDASSAPPEFGGAGPGVTEPFAIDVTWSANGDPAHFTGGLRFHGLRCTYTEHATGYFRHAAMTGTVTGPDGASWVPASPEYADDGVEAVDDGVIDIGCPGNVAAGVAAAQSTASTPLTAAAIAVQGATAVAGPQAVAAWTRMDPDGCHRTSVVLFLSEQTVRDGGAPVGQPNVDGGGAIDDLCHPGQGAVALFGFDYGGTSAPPGSIVIDHQLGSASAHLTVTGAVETIDSFEFVPVRVDVDWTGAGDLVHTTSGYRFSLAGPAATGCRFVQTSTSARRAATATGAVSFGTMSAGSGDAAFALLQDVREGQQGYPCY